MNPSSENASWLCESWDNLGGGATSMSSVGLGLETARRLDWDWDGAAAVATTNSLFVSPQAQTQHHRRQGLEQQQQQQQPPSPEDQKPHILPTQSSSFRQYTALGLTGGILNSGVRGLEGNVQLGAASSSFQPGGLLYEDLSGFGTGFPAEPSSRSQFQFHGGAGGNSGFHEVVKREEMYPVDFHAARIGLNLGHRTYFSAEDASVVNRIYRRPRAVAAASQVPRCQAEGCKADLTNAKHYHRRHKVCEYHSKATSVITGGVQQRFCQQCSRFHVLSEFDEVKRSCRKRLADHNRRRRKPHASSLAVSATASSSEATASLASNAENEDNAGVGPGCASTPPHGSQGSPSMRTESQSLLNAIPLPLMSTNPGIVTMNSPKVAVPGQQYVQANTNTVASSLKGASLSLSSPSMAMSPCKATAGSQSQNYNGLELALPWLSRSNSDYGGGASSNRQMDMLQLQQTPAILSDKTSAVESLNFLPLTSREWVLESTENQQHDQEDEHQIFSLMGASSSQQDNSVVVAQAQEHHQASSARPVEYISHLHRGGGMRSKGDTQAELHSKIADGYRTFGSTSIYDADL